MTTIFQTGGQRGAEHFAFVATETTLSVRKINKWRDAADAGY